MIGKLQGAVSQFIESETAGGFMLIGAALLAMLLVNLGGGAIYDQIWGLPVAISAGDFAINKPLLLWVNDGLMAVFFFLIGLEVKREVLEGELSSWSQASLPIFAAVGGMAVPALIFVLVNSTQPANLVGWAIPAATDIAFALGILALLGRHAPAGLKILLLALAIIDDIGAIVAIAIFYTAELSTVSLGGAAAVTALLFAANRAGVTRIAVYVLLGVVMWVFVLKSGVHATLAGVVTALLVPLRTGDMKSSPLVSLEHSLHPYAAFLILPVFAFANAGVSLSGFGLDDLAQPLPLGTAAGLFIGKQIGVFGAIALAVAIGASRRPSDVGWLQLYGLACLTGVGFTMSLFIGSLAFPSIDRLDEVKIGVLAGSLASGVLGFLLIRFAPHPQRVGAHSTD